MYICTACSIRLLRVYRPHSIMRVYCPHNIMYSQPLRGADGQVQPPHGCPTGPHHTPFPTAEREAALLCAAPPWLRPEYLQRVYQHLEPVAGVLVRHQLVLLQSTVVDVMRTPDVGCDVILWRQ